MVLLLLLLIVKSICPQTSPNIPATMATTRQNDFRHLDKMPLPDFKPEIFITIPPKYERGELTNYLSITDIRKNVFFVAKGVQGLFCVITKCEALKIGEIQPIV